MDGTTHFLMPDGFRKNCLDDYGKENFMIENDIRQKICEEYLNSYMDAFYLDMYLDTFDAAPFKK